jgi:hypothetical protein
VDDGGIYGDMLAAFPELIKTYTVFEMQARPGGGYGPRTNKKPVDGIFRKVPGGKMGIMGENREPNEVATFWAYNDEAEKIDEGMYLEEKGRLYILTKSNDYGREGGFVEFVAAIAPGPTDKQFEDRSVIDRAKDGFQ